MTSARVQLAPLRKEVRVPQGIHEAFRLFTEEIGSWWPLASHSVGGERSRSVEVETRVGGRIVEVFTDDDGRDATAVWGTVVAWDPPHRLRITWHPGSA